MSTRPAPPFDLIVITEPALADPVEFVRRLLTVHVAGRVAVQLRAKDWTASQHHQAALELRALTHAQGALLLINGDPHLCREVDADGVQLPASGPSPAEARHVLSDRMWVGASCHGQPELVQAVVQEADFALLSPWGSVPHKGPALGAEAFTSLARSCPLPVYALGGLSLGDIPGALQCGARGIAVIRDLHRAAAPADWLRQALDALESARAVH